MGDEREDFERLGRHAAEAAGERIRETLAQEGEDEGEEEGEEAEEGREEEGAEDAVPPLDPYTIACPVCEGWGVTRTRSLVPEQATRTCVKCNGVGYLEPPRATPRPETETVTEVVQVPDWQRPYVG